MAEHRLLSLELAMPSDEDDTVVLADVIPDTQTLIDGMTAGAVKG